LSAVSSTPVDSDEVTRWFDDYLEAFAACGRGERDPATLLGFYGVPLILTLGDRFLPLTSDDQVISVLHQQVAGMRAEDYGHSEILEAQVTPLNPVSALYRGAFSRQRRDGTEINRLGATYLITNSPAGRRISALAVHGA
jgi:hypothetical protein